jgi:hypothetical protein
MKATCTKCGVEKDGTDMWATSGGPICTACFEGRDATVTVYLNSDTMAALERIAEVSCTTVADILASEAGRIVREFEE